MSLEDKQFINDIRRGDEKAFEMLFRKYRRKLIGFAYTYVKSVSAAEDIVQEIFLRLWETRETLDPARSIKAFIFQATRNKAIDYIRHQKTSDEAIAHLLEEKDIAFSQSGNEREDQEFIAAVHKAIKKLPRRAGRVYKLSRNDGLTYKEIAEVMDISIKTVESQMTHSLKILRKSLSEYLPALLAAVLFGKVF